MPEITREDVYKTLIAILIVITVILAIFIIKVNADVIAVSQACLNMMNFRM